jgi:hypothetical protein
MGHKNILSPETVQVVEKKDSEPVKMSPRHKTPTDNGVKDQPTLLHPKSGEKKQETKSPERGGFPKGPGGTGEVKTEFKPVQDRGSTPKGEPKPELKSLGSMHKVSQGGLSEIKTEPKSMGNRGSTKFPVETKTEIKSIPKGVEPKSDKPVEKGTVLTKEDYANGNYGRMGSEV